MIPHWLLVLIPRIILWSTLFIFVTRTSADPDLFGHVLFGLDILREARIPTVDPYSFTSDRAWVNHEWLAETAMAAAYRLAGPIGLAMLKVLVLLSGCAVVVRELARRGCSQMVQDLTLILVVIGAASFTPTVRPQMFSFICLALLVVSLRRAEDGYTRALVLVPVLFALWANLHGGWLVGVGVLGAWVAVRLVWPEGPGRGSWLAVGLAGVAATLATPYGIALWTFLWETVSIGRADITEWQPLFRLGPVDHVPWIVTAVVAVPALLRRPRVSHAVVVLLLMVMSLLVLRVGTFFTLATAILLVPELSAHRLPAAATQAAPLSRAESTMLALVTAIAIAASAVMSGRHLSCISMQVTWAPDAAIMDVLRSHPLQGRLLTWFNWGEYAIWHLAPDIKVSYDGRRETIYSQDVIDRHLTFYAGREPGWKEALQQIDPDHIWLPAGLPVVTRLEDSIFHPVARTRESVLWSRQPLPEVPVGALNGASCFPG